MIDHDRLEALDIALCEIRADANFVVIVDVLLIATILLVWMCMGNTRAFTIMSSILAGAGAVQVGTLIRQFANPSTPKWYINYIIKKHKKG